MTLLPEPQAIKLGLVIDLDIVWAVMHVWSIVKNGIHLDMAPPLQMKMPMWRTFWLMAEPCAFL